MANRSQLARTAQALERLSATRDWARLQGHLLSMEAQQRWRTLQNELLSFESEVASGGERALVSMTDKAMEFVRLVDEFLASHTRTKLSLRTPAERVMTAALRTCTATDSLHSAAQIMWDEDCGAVPVVDSRGLLLGILTDRDLCMACYTQGRAPAQATVASAMSRVTYHAGPRTPLANVVDLMTKRKVRRVPITNEAGQLLGLVALADLLRHLPDQHHASALESALVDALLAISQRQRPPRTLREVVAAE
ncbi:MAG TPA: CBS domain-containing protein [Polyangiaceae bacterium]|jgi:signal-transduction protein with cAMP-binding, CBS, and nucleotidyltransferase domain|nr:CBS domain-containing protein [Polyangiaceae bacterium]